MVNYKDGIIYTIRTGDNVYVGSTCNFKSRKYQHSKSCYNDSENNRAYNIKLYKTIRENDGDWIMKPYKIFPCENKIELEIEEEKCRVLLNANLNGQSCYNVHRGSPKDESKAYYYANKDLTKSRNKTPDDENRHKIKINCECGAEVSLSRFHKHQQSKKHLKRLEENQKIINDV